MVAVSGLGGVAMPRAMAPRRAGAAGFRLPAEAAEAAAPLMGVSMPSLLGLQEAQGTR